MWQPHVAYWYSHSNSTEVSTQDLSLRISNLIWKISLVASFLQLHCGHWMKIISRKEIHSELWTHNPGLADLRVSHDVIYTWLVRQCGYWSLDFKSFRNQKNKSLFYNKCSLFQLQATLHSSHWWSHDLYLSNKFVLEYRSNSSSNKQWSYTGW